MLDSGPDARTPLDSQGGYDLDMVADDYHLVGFQVYDLEQAPDQWCQAARKEIDLLRSSTRATIARLLMANVVVAVILGGAIAAVVVAGH